MALSLLPFMVFVALNSADVSIVVSETDTPVNPVVKIMPPPGFELHPSGWVMTGYPFRDLFDNPTQWDLTRNSIDMLGYIDYNLDSKNFTDAELESYFAQMASWDLGLFIETPVIKEWALSYDVHGQPVFLEEYVWDVDVARWGRLEDCGAVIDQLVLDEPYMCTKYHFLPTGEFSYEWANGVVFRWIQRARNRYDGISRPEVSICLMEGYPAFTITELLGFVDGVQYKCDSAGIDGIDVFCLDPDWDWVDGLTWPCVKDLQDSIRSRGIDFSLIFWAANHEESLTDSDWYDGIMEQGSNCLQAGIRPDEYVIQSWIKIPRVTVPESARYSFTNSFRSFYNSYIAMTPGPLPDIRSVDQNLPVIDINDIERVGDRVFIANITLAESGDIDFRVFDLAGRVVLNASHCNLDPGSHQVTLDLEHCSMGLYLLQCNTHSRSATTHLCIIR